MKTKIYSILTTLMMVANGRVFAAEGEEALPPPDNSQYQFIMMIAIAFLFMYVLMWRPEQKRRKALEEQRSSLKKGDRVVAMGIIGTVLRVDEQTVIVKMYDGAKLEFYKAAISDILPPETEETGKKVEEIEK